MGCGRVKSRSSLQFHFLFLFVCLFFQYLNSLKGLCEIIFRSIWRASASEGIIQINSTGFLETCKGPDICGLWSRRLTFDFSIILRSGKKSERNGFLILQLFKELSSPTMCKSCRFRDLRAWYVNWTNKWLVDKVCAVDYQPKGVSPGPKSLRPLYSSKKGQAKLVSFVFLTTIVSTCQN